MLSSMISRNMSITMISETKLDESFPINQFLIQGFRNLIRFEGTFRSILLYMREHIPFMKLEFKDTKTNAEAFFCRDKPSKEEMASVLLL